jgi:hypothetical protein
LDLPTPDAMPQPDVSHDPAALVSSADPDVLRGGLTMGTTPGFPGFFPTVNISTGDLYTANFGTNPLRYRPPTGFNPGWYE